MVSAIEFLSPQHVAKYQIRQNLRNLLWWQNYAAETKIFTKFSSTHEEIFRLDVSLQHVAATSRLTCIYTRSHLLPWRVTATCCLVCSHLNSLIIKPWEMLTSKSWCKGSHLSCHSIQVQICLQGFQVNFKDGISRFKGTEKTTIACCLLDH